MYKSKILESTFTEIINTNNKNIVVGCVYRHPSMDANEFNEHYLSIFNEKFLLKKNKEIILMGNFNINLLRYNIWRSQFHGLSGPNLFLLINTTHNIPYMCYSSIKNSYRQYNFNWYSKWSNHRKYANDIIWSLSSIPFISNKENKTRI